MTTIVLDKTYAYSQTAAISDDEMTVPIGGNYLLVNYTIVPTQPCYLVVGQPTAQNPKASADVVFTSLKGNVTRIVSLDSGTCTISGPVRFGSQQIPYETGTFKLQFDGVGVNAQLHLVATAFRK